jgi:membrane protein
MGKTKVKVKVEEFPSLWEFGGIGPVRLVKRVWKEMDHDNIYGRSAQLAYYFLLALFPALLFIVSLLGLLANPGSELRGTLFHNLASVLPQGSSELVSKTVNEVSQAAGGGKLTFGILTALWAASGGITALMDTLNAAYDVKETRGWIKLHARAIALTLELAFLIIAALTLILFGGKIGETIAAKIGLGKVFEVAWKILQWPVVLLALATAFGSIYYFAPNLKKPQWYWVSPGAVVGTALWLAVSFAFKLYLQFFNSYSKTYGSLGAVIILMVWFYLTGLAVLVGGEVNSEIGRVVVEAKQRKGEDEAAEKKLAA